LAPSFEADQEEERALWWYHEGNRAFRHGDWKIVAAKNQDWELFNLAADRSESENLASTHPEKVEELEAQWEAILAEIHKVAPVKDDQP
jgi:arylsulfatase